MSTENKFEWTDELVGDFAIYWKVTAWEKKHLQDTIDGFKSKISEDFKKLDKQSLFQTQDGVDIREGDCFFEIDPSNYKIIKTQFPHFKNIFSTEEAAKNWVLMNKPALSVSDVLGVSKNNYGFLENTLGRLKELAKSKI